MIINNYKIIIKYYKDLYMIINYYKDLYMIINYYKLL